MTSRPTPAAGDAVPTLRRKSRRAVVVLLLLAFVCVVLTGVVYVVAVRTHGGQRLDDAALGGRVFQRPKVHRATEDLLDTISVGGLALLGGAVMAVALARGRLRLALSAGVVIAGANVTTEVLKRWVLVRPNLLGVEALGVRNTLPSGHATVAMSLGMALVLVVSRHWRGIAAIVGVGYAALVGTATLIAGWHRPSDAAAAYLVVGAWAATVAAVLVHWRGTGARAGSSRRRVHRLVTGPLLATAGAALLTASFVALVGALVARRGGHFAAVDLGGAYVAGAAVIDGLALVLMATLLFALRGIDLDPREGPA